MLTHGQMKDGKSGGNMAKISLCATWQGHLAVENMTRIFLCSLTRKYDENTSLCHLTRTFGTRTGEYHSIAQAAPSFPLPTRDRRYGIFSKNEYFYWMNNQIIFWMNEFFEWIFLILFWMNKFFEWIFSPYNWMNYWMNQKSALFIWKMNKKCLFWTERTPFACFSLFSQAVICFPIWMNNFIEWIFLPYNWINYWMNQKSALFIRKMNKKCLFWTERAPFACFSLFFTVFSSCDLFSNLNE